MRCPKRILGEKVTRSYPNKYSLSTYYVYQYVGGFKKPMIWQLFKQKKFWNAFILIFCYSVSSNDEMSYRNTTLKIAIFVEYAQLKNNYVRVG